MTNKTLTTQILIDRLNEQIEADTNFLANNGPCEGMSAITDGDYLVSTGGETGPFVKMERNNDGKPYLKLKAGGIVPVAFDVYNGTTLTKQSAQNIADHISEHATNRNGMPCIVVKMWHAVQTRLEGNKNLLQNIIASL